MNRPFQKSQSSYTRQNLHHVNPPQNRYHHGTTNGGGNASSIQRQPLISASQGSIQQHQPLPPDLHHSIDYTAGNMAQHNRAQYPQNLPNINMNTVYPNRRGTPHSQPMFMQPPMQYFLVNRYPAALPANMYYVNQPTQFTPAPEQMPQYPATSHSEQTFVQPSAEYNTPMYQPAENPPHSSEQTKNTSTRPKNIIKIQDPKTLNFINLFDSNSSSSNSENDSSVSGKDGVKGKSVDARQDFYNKVHALNDTSVNENTKPDSMPKVSPVSRAVSNGPILMEPVMDPGHDERMNESTEKVVVGIHHKVMAQPNSNARILYDPMKEIIDTRSEQITPVVSANTNAPAKHIAHKRGNESKDYSNASKTSSMSNVGGNISGSSPARQSNKKPNSNTQVIEPKKIVQQQSVPVAVNSIPNAIPPVESTVAAVSAPVPAPVVAEPNPVSITAPVTITPLMNTAQPPSRPQEEFKTVTHGKKKNQVAHIETQGGDAEVSNVPTSKEKREKNKANTQASSVAKDGHITKQIDSKSQNVPSTNQKTSSAPHSAQKSNISENVSPARLNNKKSNASAQVSTENKKNAANASQYSASTTANSFSSVLAAQELTSAAKMPVEPATSAVTAAQAVSGKVQDDFKVVTSGKKSKKEQTVAQNVEPVPEPEAASVPVSAPKEKREKNKANITTAAKEASNTKQNESNKPTPSVPSSNQKPLTNASQPSHKSEKSDKEKSDKVDKLDKTEKAEKQEKSEKIEKVDRIERPEKGEKLEKSEKAEKLEKIEKLEKVEKAEKTPEATPEVLPSAPAESEPKQPANTSVPAAAAALPPPAPVELNPDGQWSPTNPVGKKKYSKEFLYSLIDLPQCNIPPNLSMSIRVSVEKGPSGPGGSGIMYQRSKIEELYPFSPKVNSPNIRSSSAYAFPSITKRGSSNRMPNPKKIINVTLSLNENVKLKETENAWKPHSKLAKNAPDKSEEQKTEELYNKVRSILNKLTPQKLDTLVSQIKELPINNPDRLAGVIDLIIRKAIDEPNFSEAYAKMCKILSSGQFVNINDKDLDKNQTDFRRVLLNSCQKQFELREKTEVEYKEKIAREVKECTDPEKLKELKLLHAEEERKIRMKAAGNCRFIGELFKLDMLKTSIMHSCITYLLKRTEEEPLESLCKLLTTIGRHYESRLENRNQGLDPIMDELGKLANKNKKKKNAVQISSRIRFMIQDVLDLRANNWVPRRDDNTPKTIDQIQKEADREQLETNIALSSSSMKKLDRPRQDDRKKMGGRMDGLSSMSPDDWQTPKNSFKNNFKSSNYTIDTSKFENFKLGMEQPLETMRLGMPRPNMWASGAVTNKGTQPEQPRSKFSERNQFALLDNQESQLGFNSAASNKSTTMDRDKSRDNRNLSQDDEMLPKRGPSVGPPTREGSVMRSAPPSIQPPPPVVKQPVLDDEGLKRSVKTVLDEYIEVKDMKEIEHQLNKDFVTPACLGKFVDYFIEYFLEKRKDQEVIAPVLGNILDTKHNDFTPQLLVDRFHEFISFAEDLIIDYPKLWDYMAMIMGYTLTSEHFNFDHIRQSCKSILRSDTSKKVLFHVFDVINSIKSPIWISRKWNSSNVTLKDFLADNDIDEFIKNNKLEYLSDPNAPELKSSSPMLTFDEIRAKLLQILRDNPDDALIPVQSWVNANWGSGPYNHNLIRPLMTAICEASIIGLGEKNQFNKEALENHFKLIRFFVDYNPNLEAHCLYAVSILMEKLQHPKGLALNFFQNLMEHDILSHEGFKRFHSGSDVDPPENSEENRIRGIVLLGTRSFWVSLHENLDNSDDEATS